MFVAYHRRYLQGCFADYEIRICETGTKKNTCDLRARSRKKKITRNPLPRRTMYTGMITTGIALHSFLVPETTESLRTKPWFLLVSLSRISTQYAIKHLGLRLGDAHLVGLFGTILNT